jgi:hypothetical protein
MRCKLSGGGGEGGGIVMAIDVDEHIGTIATLPFDMQSRSTAAPATDDGLTPPSSSQPLTSSSIDDAVVATTLTFSTR